jgi:hypothetical protein
VACQGVQERAVNLQMDQTCRNRKNAGPTTARRS